MALAPVSIAIVGAGARGRAYARRAAAHPDVASVIAVAEPRPEYRAQFCLEHNVAKGMQFASWEDLAARPPLADAVVIATPDALHVEPAVALADLGYAILLEKPMAPTEAGCRAVVDAVHRTGVLLAVGHVMRYTPYTRALKAELDAGRIGEVMSVQHLEPVGYWHFAHSYVRGNWRNEAESSFLLLAKSCHDLDWIRFVVGHACRRVSSFGSLSHFTATDAPPGAGERCVDCVVEPSCPYSAVRFYRRAVADPDLRYWVEVVTSDVSAEGVERALRDGPYGRCVYASDNDVVDHQVVAIEFAGGQTAVFTLAAFTPVARRQTRLFGTRGFIEGDGRRLRCFDFLTETTEVIDTAPSGSGLASGGHGGGDERLLLAFVDAVRRGDPSRIDTTPDEILESHLMAFAAERSRREGRTVELMTNFGADGPAPTPG
ncbi:MAG: Gfo/Idh/MocA family protein [Acidimicrobiales bacterium]